jgi:hypothetical protein
LGIIQPSQNVCTLYDYVIAILDSHMNTKFVLSLRACLAVLVLIVLAACNASSTGIVSNTASAGGSNAAAAGKSVRHVFILVLENKNFTDTFSTTPPAPYLATTLPKMGVLLTQYYGTGHVSLDNYISMISGQAPNLQTQTDCQIYTEFLALPVPLTDGQVVGNGCVYPASVNHIGDQLEAAGFTWRQYAEDMAASSASGVASTCRHPAVNAQDPWQSATATDQYATRHVPFLYFHTVIDNQPRCDQRVVDLAALDADLASVATTPNYVFITPDLCSDGHDATCANAAQKGGYDGINDFLSVWVPKITNSPAFKKDGLLIVTFDEAEPGANAESSTSCCGEQMGFNTALAGIYGAGGGRVGAVLVSPFIKPGSVSDTPYNHYSMLRSVEDSFGLAHLGYAGQSGLVPFGADVFNAP